MPKGGLRRCKWCGKYIREEHRFGEFMFCSEYCIKAFRDFFIKASKTRRGQIE